MRLVALAFALACSVLACQKNEAPAPEAPAPEAPTPPPTAPAPPPIDTSRLEPVSPPAPSAQVAPEAPAAPSAPAVPLEAPPTPPAAVKPEAPPAPEPEAPPAPEPEAAPAQEAEAPPAPEPTAAPAREAAAAPDDDAPSGPARSQAGFEVLELSAGTGVEARAPVGVADSFDLDVGEVWAFLNVKYDGEPTTVTMVWKRDGVEKWRIDLGVKKSPHWRTWSRKRMGPKDAGAWTVELLDAEGALVQTLAFEVR